MPIMTHAPTSRVVCAAVVAASIGGVGAVPAAASSSPEPWETMQRVESPPSMWHATGSGRGVWVYGDSVTVSSRTATLPLLQAATGGKTAIDAQSGVPTRPAVDRLARRVKQRGTPAVLVFALGANDVPDRRNLTYEARRVRNIVGSSTRVIWVLPSVGRPKTKTADLASTAAVNASIRAAGASDAYVDWHVFLGRKPGLREWYLRDGVHPNTRGHAAWSKLVADATTAQWKARP